MTNANNELYVVYVKLQVAVQHLFAEGFTMRKVQVDTWSKEVNGTTVIAKIKPHETRTIAKGAVKVTMDTDSSDSESNDNVSDDNANLVCHLSKLKATFDDRRAA